MMRFWLWKQGNNGRYPINEEWPNASLRPAYYEKIYLSVCCSHCFVTVINIHDNYEQNMNIE